MTPSLPHRLFKLDVDAIRTATDISKPLGELVYGSTLKACVFCIVSFAWGKTAKFTIPNIPYEVKITDKDKLLFILQACARRGYEYVWMDALCVNQSDPHEVAQEILKMRYYYITAHVTIVFGDQYHKFAGLWEEAERRIQEWRGRDESFAGNFPNWDGLPAVNELLKDNWFYRVWTLQECLLPLRTTPFDSDITHSPPYNPARLITANGGLVDIRSLSELIKWSYYTLATFPVGTPSKHTWIHPGTYNPIDELIPNGQEEKRAWWKTALLGYAVARNPGQMHPILGLHILQDRNVYSAQDRCTGLQALNPGWKIDVDGLARPQGKEDVLALDDACDDLAEQYIERKEAALLLSMVIGTKRGKRTWAAAAFTEQSGLEKIMKGSVLPGGGKWSLMRPKIQGDILHLRVSKICDVKVEDFDGPSAFFDSLVLKHDVSKIRDLLLAALNRFSDNISPDLANKARDALNSPPTSPDEIINNILMTGIRAIFAASDNWVVTEGDDNSGYRSFPAWLPMHRKGATTKYSLLYVTRGLNRWAVIGEHVGDGDGKPRYKKVGIALVDTTPEPGQISTVEII